MWRIVLILGALCSSAAQATDWTFKQRGIAQNQEFVISVSDLSEMRAAFEDVLGWVVRHEGAVPSATHTLWGLPPDTTATEVLLAHPSADYGMVRLVQFEGIPQERMRPMARWWDTGGMFNLNLLVGDFDKVVEGLTARGWYAMTLPSSYEYPGNVVGKSHIMIGPDDLIVSFQQRMSPGLDGWYDLDGRAGHIEVGYQMLTDMDAWWTFTTELLGLPGKEIRERSNPEPIGVNDYGLPHNAIGFTDDRIATVRIAGDAWQYVGARQFTNADGFDFEDRTDPPNLGIMSMRLAVPDLDPILARFAAADYPRAAELQTIDLAPYGETRVFAVKAPGGSGTWHEIMEVQEAE